MYPQISLRFNISASIVVTLNISFFTLSTPKNMLPSRYLFLELAHISYKNYSHESIKTNIICIHHIIYESAVELHCVLRNTDIDRRERRMRNECNVDKPSYDARTMLLSRLKLIDVFPRLMKLLTSVLWFIDNKLLKTECFFLYSTDNKRDEMAQISSL